MHCGCCSMNRGRFDDPRRLTHNLRTQNWTAITLEFLIVVIGVFIGTQVANWNQERVERRETERMLVQLVPELQSQMEFFDSIRTYFATTRRYADQALAAWKGQSGVNRWVAEAMLESCAKGRIASLGLVRGLRQCNQHTGPPSGGQIEIHFESTVRRSELRLP